MTVVVPAAELFDLNGEVAFVTGASSGLGSRFAQVLAAHGAKVIATARRLDRLRDLAAGSPNIAPLALDVMAPETFPAAFDEAERLYGPVTILVNNAGVSGAARILDTSPEEWRRVQGTNVEAPWFLSQEMARRLIARTFPGSIVNIASIAGFKVGETPSAYAVSKAAVVQMTKAMAYEWARFGIRVNAIAPGYIHSEMTDAYLASPGGQAMLKRVPQRRAGDPSDLDATLLLLASRRASGFMTGSVIAADGGTLLA